MIMQLYGFPGAASLAPRMVLEEIGANYEFVKLDNAAGEHRQPAYLKLNPYARVPTLVLEGTAIFESAAICLHLADLYPNAGLLPAPGTIKRAEAYQWLMLLTNSLQPALISFFYPERFAGEGNDVQAVKANAEQTAQRYFSQITEHLAQHGPYLLGEAPCVADFFLLMLTRWGRWFTEPPYRKYPALTALVDRLSERSAVQRTFQLEGIPAPYCLLPNS